MAQTPAVWGRFAPPSDDALEGTQPELYPPTLKRASMTDLPKFFDLLSGVRDEMETLIRSRVDEGLRRLALVRRDEFEAVQELATRAREAATTAESRLEALEARLAALESRTP